MIFLTAAVFALSGQRHWFGLHQATLSTFGRRVTRPAFYCLLVILGALIPSFVMHFGNWQFGGFDHNVLVDVEWRLAHGQKPYADFICTLPPGFMLPIGKLSNTRVQRIIQNTASVTVDQFRVVMRWHLEVHSP